jgi:hypothetical protein
MAMGKRTSEQAPMWIPTTDLPVSPGHPFYTRLNAILDEAGFERFAEAQCQAFYAPVMGRPGLPPGRYFRLLLLGYFEGLDSERRAQRNSHRFRNRRLRHSALAKQHHLDALALLGMSFPTQRGPLARHHALPPHGDEVRSRPTLDSRPHKLRLVPTLIVRQVEDGKREIDGRAAG